MKCMTKLLVTLVCMFILIPGVYAEEKKEGPGAFPICYFISTPDVSGPTFDIKLLAYEDSLTGFGTLTGYGHRFKRNLKLEGSYGLITCKNKKKRVVYLTGYQELHRQHEGTLKVIMARLYMILPGDWGTGEAALKYMDDGGNWVDVKCAIAQKKDCFLVSD